MDNAMDNYGLTKYEQMTNLHEYNHALFQNQKGFMDATWEINIATGTVFFIYDSIRPDMEGKQFDYEEIYRQYGQQYVAPMDLELWEKTLSASALGQMEEEMSYEMHILNKSGIPELYRLILTPAHEENGVVDRVYFSIKNIEEDTRRRHSIEQQKQNIFAAMGSLFPCVMYVELTENTYEMYCSTEVDIIGIPANGTYDEAYQSILGQTPAEYSAEFAKKFNRDALMQELDSPLSHVEMEKRQILKDGAHWVQLKVIRIPDEETRHVIAVMLFALIDKQKENERLAKQALETANEHLRHSLSMEEQYRQAIISGAVFVYNINLTQNLLEDEIYEVVDGQRYPILAGMGMTPPYCYGDFLAAWAKENVAEEHREEYLRIFDPKRLLECYENGNIEISFEYRSKAVRNIYMTLWKTLLLIKDNSTGDILALCSAKDITEQREKERKTMIALQESLREAEMANAAKTNFLSRMSHDMRTPMNAIIGMTDIARAHINEADMVRDCLNNISNSSKHLLGLINEVLDMRKIESGKIELTDEQFDLLDALERLLSMTRAEIKEKQHELDVKIVDLKHKLVVGDILRVQEILLNLIDNAIKYTPEGGKIHLSITEKPSGIPGKARFEFMVQDNGIGISEDFMEHIFEPFTRGVDTRVNETAGAGLSLSITRTIVSLMDGEIHVESELGKGSKFTVTIYLTEVLPEEKKEEPKSEEPQKRHDFKGKRVLVVEDNKLNAKVAMGILQMLNIRTECAKDGKEAFDMLLAREPGYYDLVLMDIQMPIMNGYEASNAIRTQDREDLKKIPIIALSANAFAEDIKAAVDSGMNQHMSKPIDTEMLISVLHDWLD